MNDNHKRRRLLFDNLEKKQLSIVLGAWQMNIFAQKKIAVFAHYVSLFNCTHKGKTKYSC